MGKEVQLLQYSDAEQLLSFIEEVAKRRDDYYVNYQVDFAKLDDIYLHKLLFDYKILSFYEEDEDYAVIKLPELEEAENSISLWILNVNDSKLLERVINKIKEDYSFYEWRFLKIIVLRKQLTKGVKRFVEDYIKVQPIIIKGNKEENDQFLYYVNLL